MDLVGTWQLGTRLHAIATTRNVPPTLEIRLVGRTICFSSMPGTTPANTDWTRHKRNTVELMHRSSYGVGRSLERNGRTLDAIMGLPSRDYANHGGSYPLRFENVGVVGVVTVSGALRREDHHVVVMALAELCQTPLAEVELG